MANYRITKIWIVEADNQEDAEFLVEQNQVCEIHYEVEDQDKYDKMLILSKKASQGDQQAAIDLLKAMSE